MVLSRHARSLWVGFVSLAVSFSATRSEAQDAQNIAALGVATQSTQLGGFAPGLAIDGNLGNFTHTLAGNNGSPVVWWQLDFGEPTEFEQIILHNRGDGCCQSRFRDLTVFVLDDPQILQDAIAGDPALTVADLPDILDDAIIFQSDLLNAENVDGGGGTAGPAMLDSGLAEVIEGQVIVVTRTPDPDNSGTGGQGNNDESDVLSIGEIEVLGTIDCPAEGDTHCTGIEILPPLDEGPGAYQVTAFGEDDSGDPVSYTFTFEGPNGELNVVGPTQNNVVTATLSTGEWTVAVLVDDVPFCDDVADDAECVEEIEVRESENLALGKPATQSSQLGGFGPNLAVDGNPGNFTHTAANQNLPSTWQVDLGRESDISFINIFNRTSCCGSRLRDITVQILDIDLETVVFETPLMNPENVLGAFPLGPTNLGVDLLQLAGEPIAGFGVRVIRTPDPDNSGTGGQGNADEANVLSIGELEVYELADDCADDADTTCDAMTITGPEDDGPGLYTVVIEGSDGSGDAVTYSLLAENEAGDAQYVGHSDLGNLALELTSGTWTIRAFVDDNPRCPDQSENAI